MVSDPNNPGLPGEVLESHLEIEVTSAVAGDVAPSASCHAGLLEQNGAERCKVGGVAAHTYFLGHPRSGPATVSATPDQFDLVDWTNNVADGCGIELPPLVLRASSDGKIWTTIASAPMTGTATDLSGDLPAGSQFLRVSSPGLACPGETWALIESSLTTIPP